MNVKKLLGKYGKAKCYMTQDEYELLMRDATEEDIYVALMSSDHSPEHHLDLTAKARHLRAARLAA